MHFLTPAVVLLSQSAAVFSAAVPKPAPAAAAAVGQIKTDEQLLRKPQFRLLHGTNSHTFQHVDILSRTPTALLKYFHPTPAAPRAAPATEPPLFIPVPPNPFWQLFPPFLPFPPPPEPKASQNFSPYCHLKTQEECDNIL
ncbi:hypothetical protein QBC36DRAFT_317812 [Triangularia setosa]|uniref:Uncharacterized protein n=1 Tax=Triangularia setosa TaxID=2587417 RepID=A0AAN6WH53_9PEZI|nr:hypothetical protein QBC36DRAFT_317812 [Podospora setosa]